MSFQYVIKSGIQLEQQILCCSVLAVLLSGGTLEADSTAGPQLQYLLKQGPRNPN